MWTEYRSAATLEEAAQLLAVHAPKARIVAGATDLILEHHTAHEEKTEFDRFRNSPKRVALLVSRGVEGWNVPALFACALAQTIRRREQLCPAGRLALPAPGSGEHSSRPHLSLDG